jgi:aspartate aminotransferase-like enzyme
MIRNYEYLSIPGPTPVPPRVMNALNSPMIYHRGKDFGEIIDSIIKNGQGIFKTSGDILIFSATGRGVMEASITNCISPGERVLVLVNGKFGEIFADIAKVFGAKVDMLNFEWGEAVNTYKLEQYIKNNSEITTVFTVHCETSTGVANDIKEIANITNKYGKFLIVDAVSSAGGIEINVDDWGIDLVCTASQKSLMTPPGLGIVIINPKAWTKINSSTCSKYYWNFKLYKEAQEKIPRQTPFTSPVSLMVGLEEAFNMIIEEGIENTIARHKEVADYFRTEIKERGFTLFPKNESDCSDTVTAINTPKGYTSEDIIKQLLEKYNLRIANGLGKLNGKILRIGHMGCQADMFNNLAIISALSTIIAN